MSEQENILGRIREALQVAAPQPGHTQHMAPGPGHGNRAADLRQWLPAVGASFQDRLALFQANAANLKAEFRLLESPEELMRELRALRDTEAWTRVATHTGELTSLVCGELGLPVCRTDLPYSASELEGCSVGISQCDALVAQTGSVLISSRSAGGRALSVLPPHHVVLARRSQLLGDLPQAFALLKQTYAPEYPSFISLITGPSRTGDIERILVLGAHGPKKLTILCL